MESCFLSPQTPPPDGHSCLQPATYDDGGDENTIKHCWKLLMITVETLYRSSMETVLLQTSSVKSSVQSGLQDATA